jgi:two-component system chemotaxis response regulator CheB
MIKVLIVEDSRVVSEYLNYIFTNEPDMQVIGNVSNGKAAIDFIQHQKPDVITMDIDMPVMNGLEATRIIMSTIPVPILIVTGSRNANDSSTSIEALAAGALTVMEKPVGIGHPKEEELTKKLINMVKLMAEVTVVTRKLKPKAIAPMVSAGKFNKAVVEISSIPQIIAIGVSSGGPQVLQVVFSKITSRFPVPIVVVQHITDGFLNSLINWLGNEVNLPVHIAQNSEDIKPGHIYFAPNGFQMNITREGKIILEKDVLKNGFNPSVAHLFTSVAHEFGNNAIGIILTGMGSDGSKELKLLLDKGAVTIAQSKESALIHGMPGVAIQFGSARYVMSADEISELLQDIERNFNKEF